MSDDHHRPGCRLRHGAKHGEDVGRAGSVKSRLESDVSRIAGCLGHRLGRQPRRTASELMITSGIIPCSRTSFPIRGPSGWPRLFSGRSWSSSADHSSSTSRAVAPAGSSSFEGYLPGDLTTAPTARGNIAKSAWLVDAPPFMHRGDPGVVARRADVRPQPTATAFIRFEVRSREGNPAVYSPDPADPWNQTFFLLFTRTIRSRVIADGALRSRPAIAAAAHRSPGHAHRGRRPRHRPAVSVVALDEQRELGLRARRRLRLLQEPRHAQFLAALQGVQRTAASRPPLARALMQADLWSPSTCFTR